MVLSPRSGRIATALLYFAVISFLFCLPGSAFPKNNWLSKIHFDKWVHIGFFSVLLMLWLWALAPGKRGILWLLLAAVLYGLCVEIIQDQFIPNRSLDMGDWAADVAGSFAGLLFGAGI